MAMGKSDMGLNLFWRVKFASIANTVLTLAKNKLKMIPEGLNFHRYPKSESNRIRTLCEMKRVKAHLQTAEGILESLKTGTFCTDVAKNK